MNEVNDGAGTTQLNKLHLIDEPLLKGSPVPLDAKNTQSNIDPLIVPGDHSLTPEQFRIKIMELENYMLDNIDKIDQVDAPVTHHFAPGLYAREMFIPEGSIIIGKIHKYANLSVISQGEIYVITEDGASTIKAPHTFISKPGTKRGGYAIKDTIWTTFHPTDETDLEKIEEQVIAKSYDEFLMLEGGQS